MTAYYIRTATWKTSTPHIIDEGGMNKAEQGLSCLDPDDFMLLCDADSMAEARDIYFEEAGACRSQEVAEAVHP